MEETITVRLQKFMRLIIIIFFIFLCICGMCEEGEEKEEQSILEQWRETLLFGIAEEVLDVIKDIKNAQETALNGDLVKVLSESINIEVQQAILEYFTSQEYKGAEGVALSYLSVSEDIEMDTLLEIAFINYLASIKSNGLKELIISEIEKENNELSMAALRAVGKMKDTSKVEYLLEKLEDPEFPAPRKPTIILVFGDLEAVEAVPVLIDIIKDPYEEKVWRMYACDSLGKIGDDRAIPELKKVFSERDALLRAYAASALAAFDMAEVVDVLMQGLKDSNWRVRYHCALALSNQDAGKAVDILIYKAKRDPVHKVRVQAVRSLGEIGTKVCFDFIRELFSLKNENLEIRQVSGDILIEKDLAASLAVIKKVMWDAWDAPAHEFKIVDLCARKLSVTESSLLKDVFKKFLTSPNMYLRIYGIRGAALNGFSDLKEKIEEISKNDPVKTVRREALAALAKM